MHILLEKEFIENWYKLGKVEMFNAEINIRNAAKGLDNQEFLTKIGTYDFGFDLDLQALKAQ